MKLYKRARTLRHQPISDFTIDRRYLDLLGKSATSGRALLNVNVGRDVESAREFLKAHHPEFLSEGTEGHASAAR